MNVLTNTLKEQEREQRNKQLTAEFKTLRKAFPDASSERIIRTIASTGKFNLTEPGIKRILYATGTIVPKSARK
jgi:DNA-binding winged helix-turn-helix (wHTH) protein